jgi:hypothetical protein
MPKISSFASPEQIGEGYTVVNSSKYGRHVRAKRGTHTPLVVTETMKKAGELVRSANAHAKVINDAFKPFCTDIRDTERWTRLVVLFRKALRKDTVDLDEVFDRFYFHRRRPLSGVLGYTLEVTQTGESSNTLVVKVNSSSAAKSTRYKPDRYEQLIIALFLDADFRATVLTDTKVHRITPDKGNEHIATFPLPAGARNVIIAMKCIHQYQGKPCAGIASGIGVVNVLALS